MDRLTYTALSGMRTAMTAQTTIANNMANASTSGFRRDYAEAAALQLEGGMTQRSRVLPNERASRADFTAGAISHTGRPLDVSISGNSFLAVQADDGEEAYTRRGDLSITPSGLLVNGAGVAVLGRDGPLTVPPAVRVEIGADGVVSVQPEGAEATGMVTIGQLKLVTPDTAALVRRADDLFAGRDGPFEADAAARVESGRIEGSNVNATAALVDFMEQARRYEIQVKLLTTARDLDHAGSELLRRE